MKDEDKEEDEDDEDNPEGKRLYSVQITYSFYALARDDSELDMEADSWAHDVTGDLDYDEITHERYLPRDKNYLVFHSGIQEISIGEAFLISQKSRGIPTPAEVVYPFGFKLGDLVRTLSGKRDIIVSIDKDGYCRLKNGGPAYYLGHLEKLNEQLKIPGV